MAGRRTSEIMKDLVQLPLIQHLKEAVGYRWGVSLHFTDTNGWLQGIQPGRFFKPANPVCTAICASKQGYLDRKQSALDVTANVLGSGKVCIATCTTGISVVALPIVHEGAAIGSIYADGFILEHSKDRQISILKSYLSSHIDSNDTLLSQVDKLSVLNEMDLNFLIAIITSISEQLVDLNQRFRRVQHTMEQLTKDISIDEASSRLGIIGNSTVMKTVYQMVEKVTDADAPILITGENGTGKELIAKALHTQSKRREQPFLPINCGAFNEQLLDSELFGHVKGSFTGATGNKKGLFEDAMSGTLFLDELGEMPLRMQVKLLRVLQEGTFYPVGSTKEKKTNARIVCATNQNLSKIIAKGLFRQDLFYRLNVINIQIPPLRERADDIPLLVDHFLKKYKQPQNEAFSEEVLSALCEYSWPGNIRQLENEIQRLSITHNIKNATVDDLGDEIKTALNKSKFNFKVSDDLKNSVETFERRTIEEGLKKHEGNKSALARELGISRPSLIKKIKKYNMAS